MPKSLEQQLSDVLARKARLEARQADIEARQKKQSRRVRTRALVNAGGVLSAWGLVRVNPSGRSEEEADKARRAAETLMRVLEASPDALHRLELHGYRLARPGRR